MSMWKCPQCGRKFGGVNASHYCGKPPATIEEYIAVQPESVQPLLHRMREVIRAVLPDAQERISWSMPTFWDKRNIIHFAAFQKHIGLYPGERAIVAFSERLSDYRTSKGAVQLPLDKPLPLELVADMARWCYETENHH